MMQERKMAHSFPATRPEGWKEGSFRGVCGEQPMPCLLTFFRISDSYGSGKACTGPGLSCYVSMDT